ncbi:hypothetical protein [Halovivax sp.]|uniref:hypothetical protein n=1 Tax=Halovivax sp. TaxID=1935978 RepID=UPI0025C2D98D|nr:hypothetical protein [Halovivax sp.]
MTSNATGVLERVKQPEYTGENRCIPCTIVNVAIAIVVAAVAAVAAAPLAGPTVAAPVGAAILALSLVAIYLRGYLVPGTPTLTKRYFPDWLLAKFDKLPEQEAERLGGSVEEADRIDPERVLVDGGVVVPCADEDDLCLDERVRERWRERVLSVREDDRLERAAGFLEIDPETAELYEPEDRDHVVLRSESGTAGRWESAAAFVADVAGAEVLAAELPEWSSYSLEARGHLVGGLRAFLEQCPSCDGRISIDGETVESCCRSYEVYAVTCDDCSARLLEVTA